MLILASSSPRRRQLLRENGMEFVCCVPSVDEEMPECSANPEGTAVENARRKAAQVVNDGHCAAGDIVLAADTIVVNGKRLLGKPRDLAAAVAMLQSLSGGVHRVVTGVCVRNAERERCGFASTAVHFRKLSEQMIAGYFSLVNPLDKAGGYAIQEHGSMLIERIEGALDNVIGLPVQCVKELMAQLNAPDYA